MTTPPTPLPTMKGRAATNPRRNAAVVQGDAEAAGILMVTGILMVKAIRMR